MSTITIYNSYNEYYIKWIFENDELFKRCANKVSPLIIINYNNYDLKFKLIAKQEDDICSMFIKNMNEYNFNIIITFQIIINNNISKIITNNFFETNLKKIENYNIYDFINNNNNKEKLEIKFNIINIYIPTNIIKNIQYYDSDNNKLSKSNIHHEYINNNLFFDVESPLLNNQQQDSVNISSSNISHYEQNIQYYYVDNTSLDDVKNNINEEINNMDKNILYSNHYYMDNNYYYVDNNNQYYIILYYY